MSRPGWVLGEGDEKVVDEDVGGAGGFDEEGGGAEAVGDGGGDGDVGPGAGGGGELAEGVASVYADADSGICGLDV